MQSRVSEKPWFDPTSPYRGAPKDVTVSNRLIISAARDTDVETRGLPGVRLAATWLDSDGALHELGATYVELTDAWTLLVPTTDARLALRSP